VAGQQPGQRLSHNGICPAVDRSSEYVAFISETRAGAIYGNGTKMLAALWQGNCQRKIHTPGMLHLHALFLCNAVTD